MPVPGKKIVQPIIGRHREAIVAVVHGAWQDWIASPHPGIWRQSRSRANFVWEQMIERAHLSFDGMSGIYIIEGHATYKFLIDDTVLFRFKKGDETGLSANVPTQHALAFHDHDQDLLGLPKVHRVEVVYQLNRLETEIADVIVVARDEDAVVWSFSLLDAAERIAPLPIPAPIGEPQTRPVRHLVRPRDASETADQNKQD